MKYISVPINKNAMCRLYYDKGRPQDLVELILLPQDFLYLYDIRFFDEINFYLKKNIDEYEYEYVVKKTELKILYKIIINFKIRTNNYLFDFLLFQVSVAIKKNTGVFFYF